MHRATFFDLDGTLIDSEPLHFRAVHETLASVDITLTEDDYLRRYLSLTDRATFELAVRDFSRADLASRVAALVADKTERFAALLARGVPILPGAPELVAAAASRGPIALVTGARRHEALAILERDELGGRFEVIVTADDIERSKPDPEGYRKAFDALRARAVADLHPAECLAFEDAPLGLRAARAAGFRAVAITTSRPAEAFPEADLVVPTPAAVEWSAIERIFATTPGSPP